MKYMGSKASIAKDIVEIINTLALEYNIDNYYEPFLGGASVFEEVNIKNKIGSDIRKALIALYHELQENGISRLPGEIDKAKYLEYKEHFKNQDNLVPDYIHGYVGYMFSFWTKLYESYFLAKGNNPDKRLVLEYDANKLKNTNILLSAYYNIDIKSPSIIYCDAPYVGTEQYNDTWKFDNLVNESFDFDKYYNWLIEQSKNNIVLISEYRMPSQFKLLKSFDCSNSGASIANSFDEMKSSKMECLFYVDGGYGHELFEDMINGIELSDF